MKSMWMLSAVAICGLLSGNLFGATINVPGDYASIQEAVDASNDGDEIIVGPGTYTSTQDGHVVDMKGKAVTLRSSDGAEVTIIDGENARRGIAMFNNETSETIIDGFTIANGNATPYDYDDDGDTGDDGSEWGGGIYCSGSSAIIRGCTITGNTGLAGAGVTIRGGTSQLLDCVIENNLATHTGWSNGRGGGVYFASNSNMTGTTIRNNTAFMGGGIFFAYGDSSHMRQCLIDGNTAENRGGGIAMLDAYPYYGHRACIISNNHSGSNGGGVCNRWPKNQCYGLILWDCVIEGNTTTGRGGGVYCDQHSNVDLYDCMVRNNSASWGGGLYVQEDPPYWYGDATVCRSFFCNNAPDHILGNYV